MRFYMEVILLQKHLYSGASCRSNRDLNLRVKTRKDLLGIGPTVNSVHAPRHDKTLTELLPSPYTCVMTNSTQAVYELTELTGT